MQKNISKEQIIEIERYAENYEAYKKILSFAEEISLDRLFYRLDSLAIIFKFKNEALSLITFDKFEDIEKYIFENREEFILATDQKLTFNQLASFDKKKLAKYLTLQIPDLTGSRRDKAIKIITTSQQIINSFSSIINLLKNWIANEVYFKMFNVDIEKVKDFTELSSHLQKVSQYQSCYHFIKKLKPELSKDLSNLDKEKILHTVYVETDISKYDPLFEQSHNYTSLNLFIEDFNSYFKVLEYKSFLEKINRLKIPIVFEDTVPNSKNPKTLIIEIQKYEQIGKVGCVSWCLTRSVQQWNSYVTENRKFLIVYNFQKKSPNNVFGVTYDTVSKTIPYCQNYDNKPISLPAEYLNIIIDYTNVKNTVKKINASAPPLPVSNQHNQLEKYFDEFYLKDEIKKYEYKDHEINRYMDRFFGGQITLGQIGRQITLPDSGVPDNSVPDYKDTYKKAYVDTSTIKKLEENGISKDKSIPTKESFLERFFGK